MKNKIIIFNILFGMISSIYITYQGVSLEMIEKYCIFYIVLLIANCFQLKKESLISLAILSSIISIINIIYIVLKKIKSFDLYAIRQSQLMLILYFLPLLLTEIIRKIYVRLCKCKIRNSDELIAE